MIDNTFFLITSAYSILYFIYFTALWTKESGVVVLQARIFQSESYEIQGISKFTFHLSLQFVGQF